MSESQYVKRWKNWISRKKVFSPDELNELETYLIDKMESLQEKNNLSEKESFQQALDAMGESGLLNEEYTKIRKSPFDKVKWWALIQTAVSVLLVVFMIGSSYQQNKNQPSFPDKLMFNRRGWAEIPDEFRLSDSFRFDEKLYFLDLYSDNLVLLSYKKSKIINDPIFFEFKGTFLPETILNDPISLCQDEDSTVYILERDNEINPSYSSQIKFRAASQKIPFRIMRMNPKKELKEYSDLKSKIPKILQMEEPDDIRIWGDFLVISFLNCNSNNNYWCISTILLLNKTSLDKATLDYKVIPIQPDLVDFNIYEGKLWLLYKDRIDYYYLNGNSEPIKEGSIPLTKKIDVFTTLLQHEDYLDFILFDRNNNEIQFINKETHQTKIHKATGITNLHVFNEKEISGIFTFVNVRETNYPLDLYQLKPSESESTDESKEPSL